MDGPDDDADLKLVKASATLLSDLEDALPKLLWRPSKNATGKGRVHTQVKRKDLDNVLKLVRSMATDEFRPLLMSCNRLSPFKRSRNCSTPD